ncbi:hypothetical protein EJB05_18003, partial [Eragrostis curvula]
MELPLLPLWSEPPTLSRSAEKICCTFFMQENAPSVHWIMVILLGGGGEEEHINCSYIRFVF